MYAPDRGGHGDDEDDEIKREREREEARFSRRRIPDPGEQQRRQERLRGLKALLATMTWEDVQRTLELQEGTAEHAAFLAIWRQYQRERRRG